MTEKAKPPLVTDAEIEFIQQNGVELHRWIIGVLEEVRGGRSLRDVHLENINDPDNSEHIGMYNAAFYFLKQNAARFNIEVGEE